MTSPQSTMPSGSSGGNGAVERIVVIGASAGGLEALLAILPDLPADLPVPVCVVLHTAPNSRGRLATVIGRRAQLPVAYGEDGAPLEAGHVYVAPADHHLLVERGVLRLTRGPRENRQRPAVDTLFRSAAYAYGPGAVGVVLTGALDDGTAGLWTIKDRGGVAIVQDPAEAVFASMPASAREYVEVDHVEPLSRIGPLLTRLVHRESPTERGRPVSEELEMLNAISKGAKAIERGILEMGPNTPFTCPECAGVLVRLKEGGVPTFRCHTGHAFSLDTLTAATTEHTEEMLWNALRAIEEVMLLMQHTARHARERRDDKTAAAATRHADESERRADMLRTVLQQHRALALAVLDGAGDPGSGDGDGDARGKGRSAADRDAALDAATIDRR
jgi:two-component system, chemotaxis family, protein-glutamate methylesterase/glutaminase